MAELPRKEPKRGRLTDAHAFIQRLAEELDRCRRYGRPLALLVLQVPPGENHSGRLKVLRKAVTVAGLLIRSCDIVASFESSALLAVLLPETEPVGAAVVLRRLSLLMGDTGDGCTLGLATYPENRNVIEYFLERSEQMLENDLQLGWASQVHGLPAVG